MVRLYDQYDLPSTVFSKLPLPENDDESVDMEVLELLGLCHD